MFDVSRGGLAAPGGGRVRTGEAYRCVAHAKGGSSCIGRQCNFTRFGAIPYALRSFNMSVTENAGGIEPMKSVTLRTSMVFATLD